MVKRILVSQQPPKVATPYDAVAQKYGVQFDFIPFFLIEPVSSREFRAQRINILDYTAIVFSARSTIDAFFRLCEELRVKIPETMKYFCTTEAVAMYLQKHIVYRKRKIFYGDGTPSSILNLITAKHKDDNFLIVTSDNKNNSVTRVFEGSSYKFSSAIFAKSVMSDLSSQNLESYDAFVFCNKMDVTSLLQNCPDFKQEERAIITYGASASLKSALSEAGLSETLNAPGPNCPSLVAAIENILKQNN